MHMDRVLCLELSRADGPLAAPFLPGQYIFLNCPAVAPNEWHPFTISSAPQDSTVTCHIRVMKPGSWTWGLAQYMKLLSGPNKVHGVFYTTSASNNQSAMAQAQDDGGNGSPQAQSVILGKKFGPDGQPLIRCNGPHWAPTERFGSYRTTAVIATGIGVTPLMACMQSVIHRTWRTTAFGRVYPERVSLWWVCSFAELDSFRFVLRTVYEAHAGYQHIMRTQCNEKTGMTPQFLCEMHIFVTSAPAPDQCPTINPGMY
jgi:NAD(P)H-flavin reductase